LNRDKGNQKIFPLHSIAKQSPCEDHSLAPYYPGTWHIFSFLLKEIKMRWSLYIGKVSGIKIFIHWTFLILVLWIIQEQIFQRQGVSGILVSLAFLVAVFTCIVLHELGHAITAQRFNSKTRDIILLPIGGIARMESLQLLLMPGSS